jgi:hypothetical protein
VQSLGDPVTLSRDWLEAVRDGERSGRERTRLSAYLEPDLAWELRTDARRLAFWLNVYNAAVQVALDEDPSAYERRHRFFSSSRVSIARRQVSLNDIEHGILRRSKLWWGLGYLQHPFPGDFERAHRVDELDPRIHFALNCGATSCPPIRSYDPARVDEQLDLATESYLASSTAYDPSQNVVTVSRLFRWYRGDFGGADGVRSFLRRFGVIPDDATPRLRYQPYDWGLDRRNFAAEA